jgi:hypothetical protein
MTDNNDTRELVACGVCDGHGKWFDYLHRKVRCYLCEGTGRVPADEELNEPEEKEGSNER